MSLMDHEGFKGYGFFGEEEKRAKGVTTPLELGGLEIMILRPYAGIKHSRASHG